MEEVNSTLIQRVDAVRERFESALSAYADALAGHRRSLRYLGWDTGEARAACVIAHRLAGSGAVFGHPAISRAGLALDEALSAALSSGNDGPAQEIRQRIDQLADDLERLLRSAVEDNTAVTSIPEQVSTGGGALVVVIDDDEFLCARVTLLLESAGYRVRSFTDPAAALSLLQDEPPALVLLDLMFPSRSRPAFDVVADIRGETGERTPVVLVSSRADFATRLDGARAGADACLAKPCEDAELLAAVARHARHADARQGRCLIVEDDTLLGAQVIDWLADAGVSAEVVSSPKDCWLRVREMQPDIVLADVNLPVCNGIELATMLRQDASTSRLPIVFMTADASDRVRRAAIAAGADDFLLKPLRRDELCHSVLARMRLGRLAREQVDRIARRDAGSGGLSRHFFFRELEQVLDAGESGELHPALMLVTPGEALEAVHGQGALALAALAEVFAARLSSQSLAVWSMVGESVAAIVLPRATQAEQRAAASTCIARLASAPYEIGGCSLPGGVRAALLHLGHPSPIPVLSALRQAEQLLAMAGQTPASAFVEGYLGNAANTGEVSPGRLPTERLRLLFQPVATIDGTGTPMSAALVRLVNREGELLPAGRFLAQVESRGWLPELDAWVFRRVHALLTSEIRAEDSLDVIVTTATASLRSEIFLETVRALLGDQPMRSPSQRLMLALAETAAITHPVVVRELDALLRAAGGGLVFTGYGGSPNSQAVLEEFRPLFVRLDAEVVRRLEQGGAYAPSHRTLVDAALVADVGLIASGIESARSLSALWSKGVRRFQGYFIQEPTNDALDPGDSPGK